MCGSRFSLSALLLVLSGIAVVPGVASAYDTYYTSTDADKNCSSSGCHNTSPQTCNGCHGHGTHGTSAKNSMNLAATTDKTSYTVGDDISVTLTGGYNLGGWVRVNVYSSNGTLLVSNSTDCPHNAASYASTCGFPVTLKARAVAGMTNLYVGWMGHGYDTPGASAGAAITTTIGVGKRTVAVTGSTQHVEEVVLTNTFSVAEATPAPAPASSSGGGSFDWLLLSGLMGMFFLRRKAAR
jgi:hypothetical protein